MNNLPWQDFHFLRPLWLLVLLPVGVLLWRAARAQSVSGAWEEIVDAHLLPHLLKIDGRATRGVLLNTLGAAGVITVIALAGPTWSKLPQAVYRAQAARIVVLSLAPTMSAADVAPSRLARARLKVLDLLARQREGQTALIVYSGEPYVVAPLTEDAKTIAALVPVLTADLMPVAGDVLKDALVKAGELLAQSGVAHGDVVVVADGVRDAAAVPAAGKLRDAGHRVSVLAVGTPEGAPVSITGGGFLKDEAGAIVIPKLDIATLQQLAAAGNGRLVTLSADDSDLAQLFGPETVSRNTDKARRVDHGSARWRDEGPWLLLVLLPLVALLFRRGWLLAGVVLVVSVQPTDAYALEWSDLWARRDQQAQRAMNNEDYPRAAELFDDPQHKGAALYRAQRFDEAAQTYGHVDSADGHYNRGNALARAGKLKEALAAYQEALKRIPAHQDARYNKALVEKMLEKSPEQKSSPDDSPSSQQKDSDSKDASRQDSSGAQPRDAGDPDRQSPGSSEKNAAADARKKSPSQSRPDANSNESQRNAATAQSPAPGEDGTQPVDAAAQDEGRRESTQAMEQWLGSVADDPGGLLREKFRRQHLRRLQGAGP